MATILYSGLITEIKGKVGGSVFQKIGSSFALRSNPSQRKNTSVQGFTNRYKFSTVAVAWRALSAANRATWVAQAGTYPGHDRFGNPITLTAYQAFQYVNRVVRQITTSLISAATAFVNISGYITATAQYSKTTTTWNVTIAPVLPANRYIQLYVSNRLPKDSTEVPSNIFYCGAIAPASVGVTNIYALAQNGFKVVPQVGDCFYWLLRTVDISTGLWADEFDNIETVA